MTVRSRLASLIAGSPKPASRSSIAGTLEDLRLRAGIGELVAGGISEDPGAGGWAKPVYGNYYAQSVPVFAAVRTRAEAVAEGRLQVVRRLSGGDVEAVEEGHELQALLDRVNPWWTGRDLLEATEIHLMLWGSAFWFVEKRGRRPSAIWALRPDRMKVRPSRSGPAGAGAYIDGYTYSNPAGRDVPLLLDEVVWFRKFNPLDEYAGLSPMAAGRLSFDAGRDALLYNRYFFKKGANPGLLVAVNEAVTTDQEKQLRESLKKQHRGIENSHNIMIWDLTVGPKPERIGLTQTEMQFLEGLRWTVQDASRVFDVPRELLGEGEVTFANRELAERHFYRGIVSREWSFLSTELSEALPLVFGAEESLAVRVNSDGVRALHDAMEARESALLEQVKIGTLTINEYREQTGRDPVPWGDAWWAPPGLFPVTSADSAPAAAPADDETPTGDEDANEEDEERAESLAVRYGQVHVRALRTDERRFESAQRGLFADQRRSAEAAVEAAARRRGYTPIAAETFKDLPSADDVFNPTEWLRVFTRRGRPLIAAAMTRSARGQMNTFRLPPFRPDDPEVQRWLDARGDFWADRVNVETGRLLRQEVEEAARMGEGVSQMIERVRKVFRYSEEFRAERIARTEMTAAASKGASEIYRQSGVVEFKRWVTTQDDRTRATHLEANGQTVALSDKFQVGGDLMEAPGLGTDPAENVNCRCAVAPVVRRASRALPAPSRNGVHAQS